MEKQGIFMGSAGINKTQGTGEGCDWEVKFLRLEMQI
jgi:hypothetical protein